MAKLGPVAVYGFSTEGYHWASTLARAGVQTTIIDENLQMCTELKPEIARHYASARALVEAEPLLGLTPLGTAISTAKIVIFAPKLRRPVAESKAEVATRLRDVGRSLAHGTLLVVGVPQGLGDGKAHLDLIEKLSGLRCGEGFSYAYCPLQPGTAEPSCVGAAPLDGRALTQSLQQLGFRPAQIVPLGVAELIHARHVFAWYATAVAELDLCRRTPELSDRAAFHKLRTYRDTYLDDLAAYLLDLRMVSASLETGAPLLYLATGILRGVEGYVKALVDELRGILRTLDLKASKTRVLAAWDTDPFEIRGERLALLNSVLEKLRDYIGEVEVVQSRDPRLGTVLLGSGERTNLLVAFSKADFEALSKHGGHRSDDVVLVKGNLLIEYTRP